LKLKLTLKWTSHEDLAIQKACCVRREEYLDTMTFRRNDRPLFTEIFGPLVGLKEEWEAQGALPQELDFSAFRYRCEERCYLPVNTGRIVLAEPVILEDTSEYQITRDDLGRRMKLIKGLVTLPLPLNFPVHSMENWLKIKPLYQFNEDRFGDDWIRLGHRAREAGQVVCVSIPGGFDEPRQLLGEEGLCLAYYDQPELVQDIVQTISDTVCQVLDRVSQALVIDLLSVHEDMAGKSGPLAGPRQVKQFMQPYFRRVWELLQSRGARLFELDSDGDINAIIPALLDCGVNLIYPMEPAANMDIVQLRQRYGTWLAFCGGIDKHVLRRSQAEILAELLYKVPPMIATGGCMLGLDHRIPNGTPLENYRFYLREMWRLLEAI
jgi:hypothetical protein